MKTDPARDYEMCVTRAEFRWGLRVACNLGLWVVVGRDPEAVEKKARRYWAEYAQNGKYNSIIGGAGVLDHLAHPAQEGV